MSLSRSQSSTPTTVDPGHQDGYCEPNLADLELTIDLDDAAA